MNEGYKMHEVLKELINHLLANYEDKDIIGMHAQLVEVAPLYKNWRIGIMLQSGSTDWFIVKQE